MFALWNFKTFFSDYKIVFYIYIYIDLCIQVSHDLFDSLIFYNRLIPLIRYTLYPPYSNDKQYYRVVNRYTRLFTLSRSRYILERGSSRQERRLMTRVR